MAFDLGRTLAGLFTGGLSEIPRLYVNNNKDPAGINKTIMDFLNPITGFEMITNAFNGNGAVTNADLQKAIGSNNINITKQWEDLINNGANGTEMMNFALSNSEWSKENAGFLNPFIESQLKRDNLSADIRAQMDAYKENGINPLNVTGNLGNLGVGNIDISQAVSSRDNDANGVKDLKTLLASVVLLMKLLA